jgi:hypothetical protein
MEYVLKILIYTSVINNAATQANETTYRFQPGVTKTQFAGDYCDE